VQRVLFVNGAPRAGKDTVGEIIKRQARGIVHVAKFAHALKVATHALYGHLYAAPDAWEHCKDEPSRDFLGITPRQAYIGTSERYFKPMHGADVFGRLLLESLKREARDAHVIAITDSGFVEEARPIVEHYGADNCALLRVVRVGCDFNGDSRSHVELDGVRTLEVRNAGTPELLSAAVGYALIELGLSMTKGEELERARS